jgi:imidazolonepropionase
MGAATADHLEHTNPAGIAAMRAAGVQPVLLPGAVYALGARRYPDARAMIEAGLGIVLATDFNPGSSPTPSMRMILSLAATQMKMSPCRVDHSVDHQRGVQSRDGCGDRIARGWQARRFCDSRLSGSPRTSVFLRDRFARAVYIEGRRVY